jgi:mannitol 2-dehydrogenase
VPHYERAKIVPRILHLGVGGFHRSHMAVYTHELAESGSPWRIRGVGLLDGDRAMAAALGAQDHLYTLTERDGDSAQTRVIGSIVDYALRAGDVPAFAALLADPQVTIFSLTITEGGYSLAQENPTLEAVVTGLEARLRAGGVPLTVLSCDNLPGNGRVAEAAITTLCQRRGAELVDYVERACSFPNSMVDRITPQTSESDRARLADEVGIDDAWPVVSEAFRQWVIEDDFVAGRPAYEEVGALFSDRVHDWELYKLRMLNASHSCLAYLMALAGVVYVDEAIALAPLRRYLERLLATEAIPTLREIPGHPAADYAETTLHRLANTGVRDQVARLCIDGTAKFPSFLIPTVERQLELGGPVDRAALALAAWARYLAVTPPAARAPDPHAGPAVALALESMQEPLAFLALEEVFTPPLRESERFRATFAAASRSLAEHGPLAALERL